MYICTLSYAAFPSHLPDFTGLLSLNLSSSVIEGANAAVTAVSKGRAFSTHQWEARPNVYTKLTCS